MSKFRSLDLVALNAVQGGAANAPTIRAGATPQEVAQRMRALLVGDVGDPTLDPAVQPATQPRPATPAATPAANPANALGDALNQLRGGNNAQPAARTPTPRGATPRAPSPGGQSPGQDEGPTTAPRPGPGGDVPTEARPAPAAPSEYDRFKPTQDNFGAFGEPKLTRAGSEVAASYADPATRAADDRFQPAFDQAAYNREALRGYEDLASPTMTRGSEVAASYANPATRATDERFQPAFDQAAYNQQALAGYEDLASPTYNYAPTATNYGAFGEPPTAPQPAAAPEPIAPEPAPAPEPQGPTMLADSGATDDSAVA